MEEILCWMRSCLHFCAHHLMQNCLCPPSSAFQCCTWQSLLHTKPRGISSRTYFKDVRAFGKYNSKTGHWDRTYFCGEHTCDGSPGLDIGTIHGAYSSGKLAAEELLANDNR